MASVHGADRRQSRQRPNEEKDDDEKPTLMSNPYNPNSAAYLAYPVKHVMSSLYRRMTEPPEQPVNKLLDAPSMPKSNSGIYTPPKRSQSPFQPPPLTSLDLPAQPVRLVCRSFTPHTLPRRGDTALGSPAIATD